MYVNDLYHFVDSPVHVVAIAMNLYLLYLNWKSWRDAKLKAYNGPLVLSCTSDLILAVIVALTETAFMYEDRYFILVANGPLSGHNEFVDILSASVYCGAIHTHQVMVVCQFVWRYQIICQADNGKQPFVKTWKVLIPIAWCFAQAFNTFYLFALTNQPGTVTHKGRAILERTGWEPGTRAFPGMGHRSNIHTPMHHGFYAVTVCGGYVVIVWCQYKIIKFLRRSGTSFLESTRRMHAEVNRAMVALAITPLLTSMGPTMILLACMVVDYSAGPITVYLSVGMSLIVLVNPVTTIYFVRQYRKAVIAMIRRFLRRFMKITQIRVRVYAVTPAAGDMKEEATEDPRRVRRPSRSPLDVHARDARSGSSSFSTTEDNAKCCF